MRPTRGRLDAARRWPSCGRAAAAGDAVRRWCCSTPSCRRWTASRWPSRSRPRAGAGRRRGHDADARRAAGQRATAAARPASRATCSSRSSSPSCSTRCWRSSAPARPAPAARRRRRRAEAGGGRCRRCASCWPRTTSSTSGWRCACWRRPGHAVTVAGNGRQAVEALERERVRPGADGRADAGDGRLRGDASRSAPREAGTGGTCRSSP